ncbi:MAG: hypothetical protein EZS28_035946, partial [Streblomastix strix]
MLIETRIDLKPEIELEIKAEERIEERNLVINEGDRIIKMETNRIRRDIEKQRNINHTDNRPLTRQRNQQTGIEHYNMMMEIEMKVGMSTQMMIGQNTLSCRNMHQRIIAIEIQPDLKMRYRNFTQQHQNPNSMPNIHKG